MATQAHYQVFLTLLLTMWHISTQFTYIKFPNCQPVNNIKAVKSMKKLNRSVGLNDGSFPRPLNWLQPTSTPFNNFLRISIMISLLLNWRWLLAMELGTRYSSPTEDHSCGNESNEPCSRHTQYLKWHMKRHCWQCYNRHKLDNVAINNAWSLTVFIFTACHKHSICYGKSVHLSVTLRYYVKTRECRGMMSSPPGSPVSLVFSHQEWLIGDDPLQVKFECKEVDPL